MATYVNHDLRVVDGGTIYMPPWEAGNDKWGNLETPSVYLSSATQSYPTGTIYRHGLRTFIYTRSDPTYFGSYGVGDGSLGAGYLAESASEMEVIANGVISGAAGASTLIVNMGAACAVNAYAGGFIGIKMGVGNAQTAGRTSSYQIISNTVQDASNYVTFTIDGALVLALTTADDVVITEHPYAVCRSAVSAFYGMTIGVYLQQTQASYYRWLQTGGPCNFISILSTYEGGAVGAVPVYSVGGNAQTTTVNTSSVLYGTVEAAACQCIGYQYASTIIGGAEGSPTDTTYSPAVFLTIFN